MWVIRVYNCDDDELVAKHELRDVSQRDLERVLGFVPTAFASVLLDEEALDRLDSRLRLAGLQSERRPDREFVLEFEDNRSREERAAASAAAHAHYGARARGF